MSAAFLFLAMPSSGGPAPDPNGSPDDAAAPQQPTSSAPSNPSGSPNDDSAPQMPASGRWSDDPLGRGFFDKMKKEVERVGNLPPDDPNRRSQGVQTVQQVLAASSLGLSAGQTLFRSGASGGLPIGSHPMSGAAYLNGVLNPPHQPGSPNVVQGDISILRDNELKSFWKDIFVEQLPGNEEFLGAVLGEHDYNKGDYESSIKYFDAAIEAGDRSPRNYYLRGAAAEKLGDFEAAHADAAEAFKLDPKLKQAEALLKLTEKKIGYVGEASKVAGRSLDAGAGAGYRAGGGGRRPRGEEDEVVPDSIPKAQFARSRALTDEAQRRVKVRDYPGALSLLEKALALNPEDARAYHQRADISLRTGKLEAAVKDATRVLEIVPDHAGAHNMRALALNRIRGHGAALADADAALRSNRESAMAHYNRAFALAGLGRRGEAVEAMKRAAELDPKYRALYERLAGLPADADAALVFFGGSPDDGAAAAGLAPVRTKRSFPLLYWVLALVGGTLAAFAYFRRRSGGTTERQRLGQRQEGEDKEPTETRAQAAAPGEILRYRIVRELAAGGMGVVYEGFDEALQRKVAIKRMRQEIRANQRERERFLAEARTVAALRHPNIVEIYSVEDDGQDGYLVFEYVQGATLSEMLRRGGRFPLSQARDVIGPVCSALDYAHGMNVVHRDLKPANIMVDAGGRPKIMDFGVARQSQEALTRLALTGTVCGTPAYMAPEQEQGRVGRETDIYALGVCLYELVTERLPFEGSAGAAFGQKMAGAFTPPSSIVPGLPKGFDALLAKAMDPAPERRHRTAGEFAQDLHRI